MIPRDVRWRKCYLTPAEAVGESAARYALAAVLLAGDEACWTVALHQVAPRSTTGSAAAAPPIIAAAESRLSLLHALHALTLQIMHGDEGGQLPVPNSWDLSRPGGVLHLVRRAWEDACACPRPGRRAPVSENAFSSARNHPATAAATRTPSGEGRAEQG